MPRQPRHCRAAPDAGRVARPLSSSRAIRLPTVRETPVEFNPSKPCHKHEREDVRGPRYIVQRLHVPHSSSEQHWVVPDAHCGNPRQRAMILRPMLRRTCCSCSYLRRARSRACCIAGDRLGGSHSHAGTIRFGILSLIACPHPVRARGARCAGRCHARTPRHVPPIARSKLRGSSPCR